MVTMTLSLPMKICGIFTAGFDVNWLNQETLVNDDYEPSGYPMFSTPGDITNALYNVGFRVFSLSNNHSYDKGAGGIASSMAHWAASRMMWCHGVL